MCLPQVMWVQQEIEDFQVRKAARAWMGFLAHPGRKERLVSQILHKKCLYGSLRSCIILCNYVFMYVFFLLSKIKKACRIAISFIANGTPEWRRQIHLFLYRSSAVLIEGSPGKRGDPGQPGESHTSHITL